MILQEGTEFFAHDLIVFIIISLILTFYMYQGKNLTNIPEKFYLDASFFLFFAMHLFSVIENFGYKTIFNSLEHLFNALFLSLFLMWLIKSFFIEVENK